jgi:hypothetical protein
MPRLSFAAAMANGTFGVLGELFPDATTAGTLLEDLGIPRSRVPAFDAVRVPETYWRTVGAQIDRGRFADVRLEDLLRGALRQYPGSEALQGLLGEAGAAAGELRVLCLQAAPVDRNRLRLDVEHREIESALLGVRRSVRVVVHPATRVRDITRQVVVTRPNVVHFAGHGLTDGRLAFEDDDGRSRPVELPVLAELFTAVGPLECVVLASCWSGAYADALEKSSRFVVGADQPLSDPAAVSFGRAFYLALGNGRAVPSAYQVAVSAVRLETGLGGAFHLHPGEGTDGG